MNVAPSIPTWELRISQKPWTVVLMNRSSLEVCINRYDLTASIIMEDFGVSPPRVMGTCYYNRKLILLSHLADLDSILAALYHELGHAYAFEYGLPYKDETVADLVGLYIAQQVLGLDPIVRRDVGEYRLTLAAEMKRIKRVFAEIASGGAQ